MYFRFINELIELLFLIPKDDDENANNPGEKSASALTDVHSSTLESGHDMKGNKALNSNQKSSSVVTGEMTLSVTEKSQSTSSHTNFEDPNPHSADWARVLDAATQRRTQVLAPENLENMWTKGRNYKKKTVDIAKAMAQPGSVIASSGSLMTAGIPSTSVRGHIPKESGDIVMAQDSRQRSKMDGIRPLMDVKQQEGSNREKLKRSSSASVLVDRDHTNTMLLIDDNEAMHSRSLHAEPLSSQKGEVSIKSVSDLQSCGETSPVPSKLRCRVRFFLMFIITYLNI